MAERPRSAPTIRDVAERAGVATATVSNVLTGRRHVADDRRRLVLEAVAALGYQPNHLAASLRRQQSRTVGIVVPDLTNPFFAALVQRIENLAAVDGYQILLVDSSNDPQREGPRTDALLARRIDGLILAPTLDALPDARGLHSNPPPTVIVDRGIELDGFDAIQADNYAAAVAGTRHLLELGHVDIALLTVTDQLANLRERVDGYRATLAGAGLGDRARVIVGGQQAIEQELRRSDRPSAIFAASYDATLAAIKAIRAVDLDFPADVSLLGFDDFDWMTVLRPYVSTISQPVEQIASEAWRLMRARLAGGSGATAATSARIRLPCTLVVRESTVRRSA